MSSRPLMVGLREVKAYLADRGALAFSLLLPIVLIALLLGAFGGETQFGGTAYVVDNDGSPAAEALLEELREVDGLDVELLDAGEAADRLDRSAILHYTEIPAGFGEQLASGEQVELIQHQRGSGGQEGQIVSALVSEAAATLAREERVRTDVVTLLASLDAEIPEEQIDAQVEQAVASLDANPPVTVVSTTANGESSDLAASVFPRMASWMVLFAVTMGAQSFIAERREGTLERLLTTRLTTNELFLGKLLGNFLQGMVQFIILFALAGLVFDFFTLESWLSSLAFGIPVVAAVGAIGLVVATLGRTQDQAVAIASFFTMIMAVFGGTFFASDTNSLFGTIGKFTVTYWMNEGFDRILIDGRGLASVGSSVLAMALIFVVCLAVSRIFFRPIPGGGRR